MSSTNSSGSENGSDSGSEEEVKNVDNTQKVSDYEKQRLKRMAENKARMEALGLHKMASSLMGCAQIKDKNQKRKVKGKRKVFEEDDEDYKPDVGSQSEGDDDDDDDNCDYVSGDSSGTKFNKAKKKNSTSSKKVANKNVSSNSDFVVDDDAAALMQAIALSLQDSADSSGTKFNKAKKKNSTSSKKVANKNVSSNSDFVVDDDDAALMQAIALSLQDSAGCLDRGDHGPSKSSYTRVKDCDVDKLKDSSPSKEATGRRKRKKSTSSRVQMTEDELILHFFHFDEVGQGCITLRDLRRVAAAHDFTWSDKEMADMIQIFDSDGDGKVSLEDFKTIVGRCHMIQAVTGSKSD